MQASIHAYAQERMRAFNHSFVHTRVPLVGGAARGGLDQESGRLCTAGAGSGIVS